MLLCIDLGNTNITFGLYNHDELLYHWRIKTDHHKMPDEYGILLLSLFAHVGHRPQDVTGICMCSVVPPLTGIFEQMCSLYFGQTALNIDVGVKTGVKIHYDNPFSAERPNYPALIWCALPELSAATPSIPCNRD
jgi:type III pantothenate kinase